MKYASFGSVSHDTLRTDDLLEAFADELEYQVSRNAEWLSKPACAKYVEIVQAAREIDDLESDDADYLVNVVLMDALQDFAPPWAYFGAHPGDGADFGYWLSEYIEDEFEGLRVADISEVPDDYSGEVLYVNDHGNMRLYVADKGKLTKIWVRL